MENSTLTLGDVLPTNLKSKYADVLTVKLQEAINIVELSMPPSSPLTSTQISDIKAISKAYLSKNKDANSDSAYWNKSRSDNEAYWSKS